MNRIPLLIEMLVKQPDDVFLHYALALEYISSEDKTLAEEKLQYILEKHPDYLPAYYQSGLFYINSNRKEEAEKIIEAGLELSHMQKDFKTMHELEALLEEL